MLLSLVSIAVVALPIPQLPFDPNQQFGGQPGVFGGQPGVFGGQPGAFGGQFADPSVSQWGAQQFGGNTWQGALPMVNFGQTPCQARSFCGQPQFYHPQHHQWCNYQCNGQGQITQYYYQNQWHPANGQLSIGNTHQLGSDGLSRLVQAGARLAQNLVGSLDSQGGNLDYYRSSDYGYPGNSGYDGGDFFDPRQGSYDLPEYRMYDNQFQVYNNDQWYNYRSYNGAPQIYSGNAWSNWEHPMGHPFFDLYRYNEKTPQYYHRESNSWYNYRWEESRRIGQYFKDNNWCDCTNPREPYYVSNFRNQGNDLQMWDNSCSSGWCNYRQQNSLSQIYDNNRWNDWNSPNERYHVQNGVLGFMDERHEFRRFRRDSRGLRYWDSRRRKWRRRRRRSNNPLSQLLRAVFN